MEIKGKFYVKVWLKNLRTYKCFYDLTLNEAQFKKVEQERKGRTTVIGKI